MAKLFEKINKQIMTHKTKKKLKKILGEYHLNNLEEILTKAIGTGENGRISKEAYDELIFKTEIDLHKIKDYFILKKDLCENNVLELPSSPYLTVKTSLAKEYAYLWIVGIQSYPKIIPEASEVLDYVKLSEDHKLQDYDLLLDEANELYSLLRDHDNITNYNYVKKELERIIKEGLEESIETRALSEEKAQVLLHHLIEKLDKKSYRFEYNLALNSLKSLLTYKGQSMLDEAKEILPENNFYVDTFIVHAVANFSQYYLDVIDPVPKLGIKKTDTKLIVAIYKKMLDENQLLKKLTELKLTKIEDSGYYVKEKIIPLNQIYDEYYDDDREYVVYEIMDEEGYLKEQQLEQSSNKGKQKDKKNSKKKSQSKKRQAKNKKSSKSKNRKSDSKGAKTRKNKK